MYARFSSLLPKGVLDEFRRQLHYNNIRMDERKVVGFLFIFGFLLGAGVAANLYFAFNVNPALSFIVIFLGVFSIVFILLKMNSESKGKFVELILPDALQIIASNMKSGLTTERALFIAARPEFGALQVELKNASKRMASGEKIETALIGISAAINSVALNKTLWLISRGAKSGGQIADLLLQLAEDLKSQQSLEDESRSNISIYILLILFAAIFGAPLLFGISSFIVQVLSAQLGKVPTINPESLPTSTNLGLVTSFVSGENESVSSDFIVFFCMVTLVLTTLFSSFTIGVINSGKEIGGVRYVMPLLIAGFVIFFAVRLFLTGFFANLI